MSIEMPDEVKWLLPIVVGQSWPEGDEDAMRRMADAWRTAADGIEGVRSSANGGAQQVKSAMEGKTGEAFTKLWKDIGDGGEAALPKLKEACEKLAKSCDDAALDVEHTKLTIIASLIALAIQIAAMIAAAPATFGASTAGIAAAQGITRAVVLQIFKQLVLSILKNVAIEVATSVAIEFAVQGTQVAMGNRDGLDGGKFKDAAISGAIGGAVGGVFEGAGKAFSKGAGDAVGDAAGDAAGNAGTAAGRAAGDAAGDAAGEAAESAAKSIGKEALKEGTLGAAEGAVGSAAEQLITEGKLDWEDVGKGAMAGGTTGSVMGGIGGAKEHFGGDVNVPDTDGGSSGSNGSSSDSSSSSSDSGSSGSDSGGSSSGDSGSGSSSDSGSSGSGSSSTSSADSGGSSSDSGSSGSSDSRGSSSDSGVSTASAGDSSSGSGSSGGSSSGSSPDSSSSGDSSPSADSSGRSAADGGSSTSDTRSSADSPSTTSDAGSSSTPSGSGSDSNSAGSGSTAGDSNRADSSGSGASTQSSGGDASGSPRSADSGDSGSRESSGGGGTSGAGMAHAGGGGTSSSHSGGSGNGSFSGTLPNDSDRSPNTPASTSAANVDAPAAPAASATPGGPAPAAPRADQPASGGAVGGGVAGAPGAGGAPGGGGSTPSAGGGRPGGSGGWTGTAGSPGAAARPAGGDAGPRPDSARPGASSRGPATPDAPSRPTTRPDGGVPQQRSQGPGTTSPRPEQPTPRPDGPAQRPDATTPRPDGPGQRPGGTNPDGAQRPDSSEANGSRRDDTPDSRDDHNTSQDGADHDDRSQDAEPGTPERQEQIDNAESTRQETPAGSSFHDDPNMRDLANRVPDDGVHHTVDVHALPDGRVRVGDHTFSAKEFADMLRRDPNFDGTKPVRLLSCDAGTSGLARDLSNELGVPVTAPRGLAWTDGNGRVFASDMGPDGRPGWPPNGGWDTHHPDGTTTPASNDGFHPTRDGEDPGQRPDDAEERGKRAPRDTDNTDVDTKPSTVPRPDADGNWPANVDGVPLDPIPTPTTYSPNTSEFHERFVDYNRPDHPGYRDPVRVEPPEHIQRNKTPHDSDVPLEVDPKTGRPITDDQGNPVPLDASVPSTIRNERPLAPNTAYQVDHTNGLRTTFFTDDNGRVKWVEADAGNKPTDRASDTPGKHFNPDLGYPLIPGATYRVNHQWDFTVNDAGRTEAMTGSPSFPGSRDRYRDDNGEFSAQGRSGREGNLAHPEAKDGYAGGHLAANEMGGPGEYVNMYSQMAASNSGNNNDGWNNQSSWRAQEEELAAYHNPEAGRTIEQYQVRIDERDASGTATQVTMRWREVVFDPETGAVRSEQVRERQFANVRERVNFQDDRDVSNGRS